MHQSRHQAPLKLRKRTGTACMHERAQVLQARLSGCSTLCACQQLTAAQQVRALRALQVLTQARLRVYNVGERLHLSGVRGKHEVRTQHSCT